MRIPVAPMAACLLSCEPAQLAATSGAPSPSDARTAAPTSDVERALLAERTGTPAAVGLRTGTVVPALHPDRASCSPFQQGRGAVCVAGFEGPIVVTDLEVGGACPDELLILAGSADHPEWYVIAPPHTPLSIHSAQLVVRQTDGLVFAARRAGDDAGAVSAVPECYVTWSGRH